MTAIDVVVPTYNRAALIGETLAAILGQSLPPARVVVVDDGSSDDTAGVVAGFGGRVTLIRQPNSGDLVARNTGLRATAAPLVAFCDSDDVWAPGFLEAMAGMWRREPGLRAGYSDFRLLQGGQVAARSKFADAPAGYWAGWRDIGGGAGVFEASQVGKLLEFQPFFPSCMVVARDSFLALGGWDEAVSRIIGCDFATALRVFDAPPVGVLREALVCIRKHAGNISADTEKMNLGDARILAHVLATRPVADGLRPAFECSIAARRLAALHGAFARQDFAAVRAIAALLPPGGFDGRGRVKAMIARLPPPLARRLATRLSR